MGGFYLAVIFICLLQCVFSQRMFNISGTTAGESNICGEGVTLAPRSTENVTLVSKGRLPGGFCEVTVVINNSGRCKREICIQGAGTLDNTGLLFHFTSSPSNAKSEYQGPAYQELKNGKCFDGYLLFMNISEPASVGHNFNFQLFLRPSCNDSNSVEQIALSDADSLAINKKDELERAWLLTTVYGAVTGVCLAIFFLIILLITYCYYKAYPYGNKKREPATSSVKRQVTTEVRDGNAEEMKLLERNEPGRDSLGIGVSDGDVIDLEEGTSQKEVEPDKEAEDQVTVEDESKKEKVEESGENVEQKTGNDFVNVDLKAPGADSALLDSD